MGYRKGKLVTDRRHGGRPDPMPRAVPYQLAEQWVLYEGVSAPIEYCGCEQSSCVMCEDDDG